MRIALWLAFAAGFLRAQLTTLAGGPPADGSPPLQANQGTIYGVAADADGNLYASVSNANIIIKIDTLNRFSVLAGTGVFGFSGDGGPAKQAALRSPHGLAVGPDRALYFSDRLNHRIRRIDLATNRITTTAGTGKANFTGNGGFPALQSAINEPTGLDVDSIGNVYIACYQNNRVVKIENTTGLLKVVAGNGNYSGISQSPDGDALSVPVSIPVDVKVDAAGNVYIAHYSPPKIRKVANGVISTLAGGGFGPLTDGASATAVSIYPYGISLDSAGNVFFSSGGVHRIRNGLLERVITDTPFSLRHDSSGNLLLGSGTLLSILHAGTTTPQAVFGDASTQTCPDSISAATTCMSPGVLHQTGDRILFADGGLLRATLADGALRTVGGTTGFSNTGDGGLATSAGFAPIKALASSRTAYYVLAGADVRRIDRSTGVVSTLRSGVAALASDDSDTLYFLTQDIAGNTARLVRRMPSGVENVSPGSYPLGALAFLRDKLYYMTGATVSYVDQIGGLVRVAGTGAAGEGADNIPATLSAISAYGLSGDPEAALFLAEYNRVRKVDARTGVITTIAGTENFGFGDDGWNVIGFSRSNSLNGVTASPNGGVFVSDVFSRQIRAIGNPCLYGVNKTQFYFGATGDSARITITTTPNCQWSATSDSNWLTASNSSSGRGRGEVIFSAAANNTGTFARKGILTLAGYSIDVFQAPVQCSYSFSVPSLTFEANGGNVVFQVTTGDGCDRGTVIASPWIEIVRNNLPVIPLGSGPLEIRLTANPGPTPRAGFLTMGGQSIPILQKPAQPQPNFTDVPLADPFADFIGLLRTYGITQGCTATTYCPDAPVTRGQMAAFLVRTLLASDDFPFQATPVFTDVTAAHPFFRHIQKLLELGVTQGCGPGTFCPDVPITRGQMAAFLVRGVLGTDTFPYPAEAAFTDILPASTFFPHVQKLRQFGVTQGCTATTYCPDAAVTRGQMSAFLIRGFPK